MTPRPPVFETMRSDVIAVATGFGGICEQRAPRLSLIFVSGALSISGTSSAEAARLWEAPYVHESDATASGLGWEQHAETPDGAETTRQAISELRRISGLTWEQLGELFDVSRRALLGEWQASECGQRATADASARRCSGSKPRRRTVNPRSSLRGERGNYRVRLADRGAIRRGPRDSGRWRCPTKAGALRTECRS